jgi:ribosomal protein L40E
MCNYTPDSPESPDRMDAMVWAGHELQMNSSAMIYLSAISKLCMKCDMPNKKVSTVCRGCGAQLPEAA